MFKATLRQKQHGTLYRKGKIFQVYKLYIYHLTHVRRATVVAPQEAAGWAWVLHDFRYIHICTL